MKGLNYFKLLYHPKVSLEKPVLLDEDEDVPANQETKIDGDRNHIHNVRSGVGLSKKHFTGTISIKEKIKNEKSDQQKSGKDNCANSIHESLTRALVFIDLLLSHFCRECTDRTVASRELVNPGQPKRR